MTTSGAELTDGWLSLLETILGSSNEVHSFDTNLLSVEPEMFDGIEEANHSILQGDAEPGFARYNLWKQSRAESIARGERKSSVVVAATELQELPGMDEMPIETLTIRTGMTMRSTRNLGKLVHAILQDIDLSGQDDVEIIARAHGRHSRSSSSNRSSISSVQHYMTCARW